jgi:ribosomal protein S17
MLPMSKKLDWKVVDKIEDSGRGYVRIFSGGQMIATVENGFVKVGDEVAIKGGRVYIAEK